MPTIDIAYRFCISCKKKTRSKVKAENFVPSEEECDVYECWTVCSICGKESHNCHRRKTFGEISKS